MKFLIHFKSYLLLLFTSLLFLFNSCSDKIGGKYGYFFKDGMIINSATNKLYSGRIDAVINNKKLVYDVVKGKKEGTFISYFSNGKVEMIGTMQGNKNSGYWKYYYSNGNIESEGNFINDEADGNWKWYYPNGKLKEKGIYLDGKKNGVWIIFEKDGKPQSKLIFVEDKKVNEIEYYKSRSS